MALGCVSAQTPHPHLANTGITANKRWGSARQRSVILTVANCMAHSRQKAYILPSPKLSWNTQRGPKLVSHPEHAYDSSRIPSVTLQQPYCSPIVTRQQPPQSREPVPGFPTPVEGGESLEVCPIQSPEPCISHMQSLTPHKPYVRSEP